MKVLVIGGGGREHALCWKLRQSPLLTKLYCAPGNPGIAEVAECVALDVDDNADVVAWALVNGIDFVVIGPEAPLVAGLVDDLADANIRAFGPSLEAAALEGSKGFMKDILAEAGVPTAWYGHFDDQAEAEAFIRAKGAPIVVKTDGLAAGKGVILCQTVEEALAAVNTMMSDQAFGEAGSEVVIEEFLIGEEASFFALADGTNAVALVAAQDHKAVGDGDTGPNTGGMGAYSPAPVFTPALQEEVMRTCILPTVETMKARGTPYSGVLFCGLMITADGPKVLEYNARFGDPECQALMLRLESDLLPLLLAASDGTLPSVKPVWRDDAALVVVMAANGYPGPYARGSVIGGLDAAKALPDTHVFHAGTKKGKDGSVLANGGRVLGIAAVGASVAEAQKKAYAGVDVLDWSGGFCRRDIGWRAIARESIDTQHR